MIIAVVYDGSKFFVSPNPAVVKNGTDVRWMLYYTGQSKSSIKWSLRFAPSTPFGPTTVPVEVVAKPKDPVSGRPSEGEIDAGAASNDGLFKYDIIVQDADTGKDLGNDDPYLIVVPKSQAGLP